MLDVGGGFLPQITLDTADYKHFGPPGFSPPRPPTYGLSVYSHFALRGKRYFIPYERKVHILDSPTRYMWEVTSMRYDATYEQHRVEMVCSETGKTAWGYVMVMEE